MRVLIIVIMLMLFYLPSRACMCWSKYETVVESSLKECDYTIIGKCISYRTLYSMDVHAYIFLIESYFNGKSQLEIPNDTILLITNTSSCGIRLKKSNRSVISVIKKDSIKLLPRAGKYNYDKYRNELSLFKPSYYVSRPNDFYVPSCGGVKSPYDDRLINDFKIFTNQNLLDPYVFWFNFLGLNDKSYLFKELNKKSLTISRKASS